jgi:DNA-binding HxlR family transcriptional regulator
MEFPMQTEEVVSAAQANAPISTLQVLKVISDEVSLDIFREIEKEPKTKGAIMQTVELSHKEYYSRMKKLVKAGLIRRKRGAYVLTPFGRLVYEANSKIAKAARESWKLRVLDALASSTKISEKEHMDVIDKLIDDSEIKKLIPSRRTA